MIEAGILLSLVGLVLAPTTAFAVDGQDLDQVVSRIQDAARQLEHSFYIAATRFFFLLATIEIVIVAIYCALRSAVLETWIIELVRRFLMIGFFLFVLTSGVTLAKEVTLYFADLGAGGVQATPSTVFDIGIRIAARLSVHSKFATDVETALALSAAIAIIVVVVAMSLLTAIFFAALLEAYLGVIGGLVLLGFGSSSLTNGFAVRYLVYAFSIAMKLLVTQMIATASIPFLQELIELKADQRVGYDFQQTIAVAGITIVLCVIAFVVPRLLQRAILSVQLSLNLQPFNGVGEVLGASFGAAMSTVSASSQRDMRTVSAQRLDDSAPERFHRPPPAREFMNGTSGSPESVSGLSNPKLNKEARQASRPQ